ncbi:MAG: toprim domain-containing protein [Methylococcaceae bacterium]|nr:toprim domain-containing protein [Methylococcaceae bacterium]MDP3905045.1 toprim domain-containing protein [Methylococcaceae bacterium]
MLSNSINEIETAFFNHAAENGVVFTDPLIADGVLHRSHVQGDKAASKNGAYILHYDGNPSGWYQHFVTGVCGTWSLTGKRQPLSKTMFVQIEAGNKQRQQEQQQRHTKAAIKAQSLWAKSKPGNHSYLTKKRVEAHNSRVYGDALVIPIYDESSSLVNLQFINADGSKRFLAGGKKKSCYSTIGELSSNTLLICEGWATGASLYEHSGHGVIVALDAGNLEPVARVMRHLYPTNQIIIAGDNDESGTGQKAARAAALAVGGKYIVPELAGYDWNDLFNMEGV